MKKRVTVKAPINIAIIKYWGKQDESLIIPCNGSISATLDTEAIYTLTTISFDDDTSQHDSFSLNGRETALSTRMARLLSTVNEWNFCIFFICCSFFAFSWWLTCRWMPSARKSIAKKEDPYSLNPLTTFRPLQGWLLRLPEWLPWHLDFINFLNSRIKYRNAN